MDKEKEKEKQGPQQQEEGLNLASLNRDIDLMSTEPKLVDELERDFNEVSKVFIGDPELELFKSKYIKLMNTLRESLENEQRWSKKCKESNSELVMLSSKVSTASRMAQEDAATAANTKKEIESVMKSIEDKKKQEIELHEKIKATKDEIQELQIQLEKGISEAEMENQTKLSQLAETQNELTKAAAAKMTKTTEMRAMNEEAMSDLKRLEEDNWKLKNQINDKKEQIAQTKEQTKKEDDRKRKMEEEMEQTKKKIEEANKEKELREGEIRENEIKMENLNQTMLTKMKERDKLKERSHLLNGEKLNVEKERDHAIESVNLVQRQIEGQEENRQKAMEELEKLKKLVQKQIKEAEILKNAVAESTEQRIELEHRKETLIKLIESEKQHLSDVRKNRDSIQENIAESLKEKSEKERDIKKLEKSDRTVDEEIIDSKNTLKKLENQIRGYRMEAQRLNRVISILEKEQEKYGIEASEAHAKYYQTIEELKIKNNIIAELQKKNAEVEAKLKHQQNLYEAVRSDRNLYSKNLLEAQEEIAELTKKYTRQTHYVDQLKEEIKTKDAALVKEDVDFHKIVEENEKIKIEKQRVKKNIKNTEEAIKTQENQINNLKGIITNAMAEKTKQVKDYDMVISERDILGAQLIKRNQELSTLYEKIKSAQANLAKGEIFFREKQSEFKSLKDVLLKLRQELSNTQDQIANIKDLENEIHSLQKELLAERTKVKALQEELDTPMNVHRWRKLEATDQDNYERILKIQTLQRRLVAKTDELIEKEMLIKDKEKLFVELKTILARQPGAEIRDQLQNYKEALKDKTGQLKKMLGELKSTQDQITSVKFDIDRLKSDLGDMKRQYFSKRSSEDQEAEDAMRSDQQVMRQPDQNPLSGLQFISKEHINQMMKVGGNS